MVKNSLSGDEIVFPARLNEGDNFDYGKKVHDAILAGEGDEIYVPLANGSALVKFVRGIWEPSGIYFPEWEVVEMYNYILFKSNPPVVASLGPNGYLTVIYSND